MFLAAAAHAAAIINNSFKYHFRTADGFSPVLPYLYIIFILSGLLTEKREGVAKIALHDVCNLEPLQVLLSEHVHGEEVKDVFDVFHAVHVAVDVDVAITHLKAAHGLRGTHLHP